MSWLITEMRTVTALLSLHCVFVYLHILTIFFSSHYCKLAKVNFTISLLGTVATGLLLLSPTFPFTTLLAMMELDPTHGSPLSAGMRAGGRGFSSCFLCTFPSSCSHGALLVCRTPTCFSEHSGGTFPGVPPVPQAGFPIIQPHLRLQPPVCQPWPTAAPQQTSSASEETPKIRS